MPIVRMKPLLAEARAGQRAVGAFNVGNMEMLIGTVKAAEASGTPVILQIAEKRLGHSPLHLLGPMMVSAARNSKARIAVHLDHGYSRAIIQQAIDCGFTSVMFDGSALPLDENIRRTAVLVREANARGIDVEAEVGVLGGNEGGGYLDEICTKPDDAARLSAETGCDALAVAIGNAHGHYKCAPKLNFDALENIGKRIATPLVLHGGTGLSPEDFRMSIARGICKINIATAIFDALVNGAAIEVKAPDGTDYFRMNERMIQSVYDTVIRHIEIFNNR